MPHDVCALRDEREPHDAHVRDGSEHDNVPHEHDVHAMQLVATGGNTAGKRDISKVKPILHIRARKRDARMATPKHSPQPLCFA